MKINGNGIIDKTQRAQKKNRQAESGFENFFTNVSAANETSAGAVSAAQPVNAPSSLLSLQEVGDGASQRTQAQMMQGQQGIEVLNELQQQLLMGEGGQDSLQRMQDKLAEIENIQIDDARLRGVMDDIKLRLAVEIAKRERA